MQISISKRKQMEKQVVIIGAGINGILACKYLLKKGFNPVVFEAAETVGGVWRQTLGSTRLQNSQDTYRFLDFPWPSSVQDKFPDHNQLLDYIKSHAQHFDIFPYIKFNSKVIGIDYVGESYEEMRSWDLWNGNNQPFGCKGKWHINVQDTKSGCIEVHQAEFVILCIGQFSGLPNIPSFPPKQGPEVFKGKVLHSNDYSAVDKLGVEELVKEKRVTIIGSHKSGVDIAAECANINGAAYPCTLVQRNAHWGLPYDCLFAFIAYLSLNRFAELLVHKAGETFPLSILATLLKPLRWVVSKIIETYLKWILPMTKYGMVPNISFLDDKGGCQVIILPDKFYDKIEEGSILIKNTKKFAFCNEGLIFNGETQPLETDVVIFATGFNTDEKLKNMFDSSIYQDYVKASATDTVPLYRQIIPPRIPKLAVLGFTESVTNTICFEVESIWLANFLDGNIMLPRIKEMEKSAKLWGDHFEQANGRHFRRSCLNNFSIWYTDQLCRDLKYNPKRKNGFLAEWFEPYGPEDYADLPEKRGY